MFPVHFLSGVNELEVPGSIYNRPAHALYVGGLLLSYKHLQN